MSAEGQPKPGEGAGLLGAAKPDADLEGRLVLENMRAQLFGKREKKTIKVGRYELIARLGAGALGLVVAAKDPELGRKVAIKLLPARVDWRKLLREARALARLSSPHVVAILDVGTFEPGELGTLFGGDPGDPAGRGVWLAMELVDGTPLDKWIGEGPHEWRRVLEVWLPAGRGLADAHEARMVHRDFKPANVILGRDGRVRVVDFGLARSPNLSFMTSADAAVAADDEALLRGMIGTPAYMAPEQHRGEAADALSDQFAFAIALYEALYGDLPFPGPRYEDFAKQKSAGPPEPPKRSAVPPEVQRALARALDPDRDARFESMEELLAALEVGPADERPAWLVPVAAVAVVGALAGTVWYAMQGDEGSQAACDLPEDLAARWGEHKGAIEAAFTASDKPYADVAFQRVGEVVGRWSDAWMDARGVACGGESEAARWCLEDRRVHMLAVLEALAGLQGSEVSRAEDVLGLLYEPGACSDAAWSGQTPESMAEPRVALAELAAWARAGRDVRGSIAQLQPAAEDAGATRVAAEAALELAIVDRDVARFRVAFRHAQAGGDALLMTRIATHAVAHDESDEAWVRGVEEAQAPRASASVAGLRWRAALAQAHAKAGQVEAAASEMQAVVDAASEALGARDPVVAGLVVALAPMLDAAGRPEQASARIDRAVTLVEAAYGPGHPELAAALTQRASMAQGAGRMTDARADLERALELLEADSDPGDVRVARAQLELAKAYVAAGRPSEAIPLLDAAHETFARGDDPEPTLGSLALSCRARAEAGQGEAARGRCEKAIHARDARPDRGGLPPGELENALAGALLDLGEVAEAKAKVEAGIGAIEAEHGRDHASVAPLLLRLAEVGVREGESAKAIGLLDRVAALSVSVGVADPDVARAIAWRARLWLDAGKADRALASVQRHVSRLGDATLPPRHHFELQWALALAQHATGDARAGLQTARVARRAYGQSDAPDTARLDEADAWIDANGEP